MVKKETIQKKKFEPVVKADARVVFEEEDPEFCSTKFSEFEYLQKQVEVLKETVEELVGILRANNITRSEIIEADYFDDDEVFTRLEKEKE